MNKKRKVKLDYGESQIEIPVPEEAAVITCEDPPALGNPEETFRQGLNQPIGMEAFRDLVSKGSKVCIAIDSPPRSGIPKRLFIPILLEELQKSGVPRVNVTIVCGNATQHKRTPTELLYHLGPELFHEFWPSRLLRHDCTQDLVYLGESELGDYVEYNKRVAESDLVIYMGECRPINWGGFTGTGVVIGLGSARSIRSHHTWVIAHADSVPSDPRTSLYMKHKQAVHAQIEKATDKKILYTDVVMNNKEEISGIFVGHCPEINEPEWRLAEEFFRVPSPQADILVIGLPLNQVYGSTHNPLLALTYTTMVIRSWVNKPILRSGGICIVLVKCNGTIDTKRRPSDPEVWDLFGNLHSALDLVDYEDEFLTREDYIYRYQYCNAAHPIHPFWLFYENQWTIDHPGKVIFAGDVNPGSVRRLGCTPAKNFEHAWSMAEQMIGKHPRVVVVPNYMSGLKIQFDVQ